MHLFLDRDGVINKRIMAGYVKTPGDFVLIRGVKTAMKKFNRLFDTIVVVTNQQGIGKGLMTEEDLERVHQKLSAILRKSGGRIDAYYFCPDLATKEKSCRKPAITMALQAKKDFPEIDFAQSTMVGDSLTDMEFGKRLGMKTVFVNKDKDLITQAKAAGVDIIVPRLSDFAALL